MLKKPKRKNKQKQNDVLNKNLKFYKNFIIFYNNFIL